MPKCKRCGNDAFPNKFVCPSCLENWQNIRFKAYAMVEEKLGGRCSENHAQFVKEVKKTEKMLKKNKSTD